MKIYNRQLEQIKDLDTQTRIEQILSKQIEFLVSNYGIDRKMLEKKLENLSIIEYSKRNDKTYFKKINGELREFQINDSAAAFCGQKSQNYDENKCLLDNAIFIDKTFSGLDFDNKFSHELFHFLSGETEMTFDDNGEAVYKSGISLGKYDKEDTLISEESIGLNEGITELLALKLTGLDEGSYNTQVIIANILMVNSEQELVNAYFSKDKAKIQKFYDDFDKRQSSISSKQLKTLPYGCNFFTLDTNLLKGCLEYAFSFCENMEQLNEERTRLLPIFKEMRKEFNMIYSEENFDILNLWNAVINTVKSNIQSKDIQDLGKETLDVQKETPYIDDTEENIEREQKSIITDKDKNTLNLQ